MHRTLFGQRLVKARLDAGLTQVQAAKAVGMSQSALSEAEISGESSGYTSQLATLYGVSAHWLATGRGGERDTSEVDIYASGEAVLAVDRVIVPVFEASASMGLGRPQPDSDTVVDNIRLTKRWVDSHIPTVSSPSNLAVLSAYGDSMSPTFTDGDLLLVDRGVTSIKLDAIYVLSLNHELYIKRIQRRITDGAVIIKSDNPLYDPVIVENGNRDNLSVLGRVVWAWNGRKL